MNDLTIRGIPYEVIGSSVAERVEAVLATLGYQDDEDASSREADRMAARGSGGAA